MGQIVQFIRPYDVFDPETLMIFGDAYDKAIASLHDRGQPRLFARVWLIGSSTLRQRASAIGIACVRPRSARLARDPHSIV